MLVGSFLSGLVPMAFRLSDNKSRLLALLGSGILCGTALAIIIPEGVDSLYGQQMQQLSQRQLDNFKSMPSQSTLPQDEKSQSNVGEKQIPHPLERPDYSKAWTIGISLVVGFVLMLLIDQFSIYQASEEHDHHHIESSHSNQNYTLANLEDDDFDAVFEQKDGASEDLDTTSESKPIAENEAHRVVLRTSETNNHTGIHINPPPQNRYYDHSRHTVTRTKTTKVTPTLGLVIHAAADGIALGAAATTSHREVEMIIFLAIMLHKAPAAFSLVVLLLHRGLKHSTIRRHLLAFSFSAPIAAIVTYYGLSQSGKEALRRNNATGVAMLFSAGTFLYVATVHVLPDLVHNKLLTQRELFFLVGGAFLPLLLAQTV